MENEKIKIEFTRDEVKWLVLSLQDTLEMLEKELASPKGVFKQILTDQVVKIQGVLNTVKRQAR